MSRLLVLPINVNMDAAVFAKAEHWFSRRMASKKIQHKSPRRPRNTFSAETCSPQLFALLDGPRQRIATIITLPARFESSRFRASLGLD
jgi:hypothetical protein